MADALLCSVAACRQLARRYVITSDAVDSGRFRVDLCTTHDRPIRLVEEIARKEQATQVAKRHRGVTTEYLAGLIEKE